jgi:hypothetical protein
MPCYEPLCCNANRKPIPLFSLYNSLNFPDSIAINYCAPSQTELAEMSCRPTISPPRQPQRNRDDGLFSNIFDCEDWKQTGKCHRGVALR